MIQSGKDGQFEMNCVSLKSYLASGIGGEEMEFFLILSTHTLDLMGNLNEFG